MEAYKNHWFDHDGNIVLPALPKVDSDDEYRAGSTEYLAVCWGKWRRTEQQRRFLGGSFEHYAPPELPNWAPKGTKRVTAYSLPESAIFDYAANERLEFRLNQTMMEMLIETNMEAKATGRAEGTPLLPKAFVSASEVTEPSRSAKS